MKRGGRVNRAAEGADRLRARKQYLEQMAREKERDGRESDGVVLGKCQVCGQSAVHEVAPFCWDHTPKEAANTAAPEELCIECLSEDPEHEVKSHARIRALESGLVERKAHYEAVFKIEKDILEKTEARVAELEAALRIVLPAAETRALQYSPEGQVLFPPPIAQMARDTLEAREEEEP